MATEPQYETLLHPAKMTAQECATESTRCQESFTQLHQQLFELDQAREVCRTKITAIQIRGALIEARQAEFGGNIGKVLTLKEIRA